MLGLGANGAPSQELEVAGNGVQTEKLVRLETRDFEQWKRETGVDQDSRVQ